jgi:ppGpp synthetase/RelA/SpoT-type nucleotidyltranferase
MQDIAGCRVVVNDLLTQDIVVENLKGLFEKVTVVDRRERPSHGYRAVHVIVERRGKLIEIQVRTSLQHAWAQVSEKLSDITGPSIKYGIGDEEVLLILARMSDRIMQHEEKEGELNKIIKTEGPANVFELAWDVYGMKEDITQMLNAIGENLARSKGRKDDLSN